MVSQTSSFATLSSSVTVGVGVTSAATSVDAVVGASFALVVAYFSQEVVGFVTSAGLVCRPALAQRNFSTTCGSSHLTLGD